MPQPYSSSKVLTLAKTDHIIGWRIWTLDEGHLVSISGTVWEPRQPVRAVCRPTSGIFTPRTSRWGTNTAPDPLHLRPLVHGQSPDPMCSCGIYALDSPERLSDETHVVGSVRLWGRIIHADNCYRAEFAYPDALYVPRSATRALVKRRWVRLLESYGVPVSVVASLSEIRTEIVTARNVRAATEWGYEPTILNAVVQRSTCADSRIHGIDHWKRVAATGVHLADKTVGADAQVVVTFGILHDSLRLFERHDPDHGLRASLLANELRDEGVIKLDDTRMDVLCYALEHHDRGRISSDPTVGCAWDADRLDLPRVGVHPMLSLLSTEAARRFVSRGSIATDGSWRQSSFPVARSRIWHFHSSDQKSVDSLRGAEVLRPAEGSNDVGGVVS